MANGLRTADYDFHLPPELIAQTPLPRRDASRLMVVDRAAGTISHRVFTDLPELTAPGDLMVVNRSRVVKARLLGTRIGSGAPAEVFLLQPLGDDRYEAMVSPGGKLKPGRVVQVAGGFTVEILEVTERRTRIVRVQAAAPFESIEQAIDAHGHIPLPPYIERADDAADVDRYQTVYAREPGSVAAPTAGLHFTPELLAALDARGVRRGEVVLHVGAGTFKPVETDDPADHQMHEERYVVPDSTAQALIETRAAGKRVWAVGTTSVRTLESAADPGRTVRAGAGETRIFLRPPARPQIVDALVTNFHLPRSTLIMLVATFAGYDLTMRAYREAIAARYRFYSYGDAMAVV
ncbi:MAG: tRNA preQ1(34) S-adenosylmethionine ribosyltransferase-isomerase QueA [Gemmatimonadaceae bacterium]|nr:tRNA preQ1(34) S-adenosylmethionine ribosyltransferase-isomerase QueA [Gemmatimonadaceae bacterium]NUS32331.1 tRNA preQ1(34) S-adenosylmethionine ribosyltransferase-isomerase QueA [Gemmatimonadaceae bacterium]